MRDAWQILAETSRTFALPIGRLPSGLKEAVGASYLCMRSIDEIEDRRELDPGLRGRLLRGVSRVLQGAGERAPREAFERLFRPHQDLLPEVTLRIGEWADLPPATIRPRVWDAIGAMADRMAGWVEAGFRIQTEEDLDAYTYAVAGAVGVLLSDLWAWFDGTQTDRVEAAGFGRGLQAVNILRNRAEDLRDGVDFFPAGSTVERMRAYARRQLAIADRYTDSLPAGAVREFCVLPLALAHATLAALEEGREKLTRAEVLAVVQQALAGAT